MFEMYKPAWPPVFASLTYSESSSFTICFLCVSGSLPSILSKSSKEKKHQKHVFLSRS